MDDLFALSDRAKELRARLLRFMDDHIYPNEAEFDRQHAEGDLLADAADHGGSEVARPRRRAVEPVPAA